MAKKIDIQSIKNRLIEASQETIQKVAMGVAVDEVLIEKAMISVGIEEFEKMVSAEQTRIKIKQLENDLSALKEDRARKSKVHAEKEQHLQELEKKYEADKKNLEQLKHNAYLDTMAVDRLVLSTRKKIADLEAELNG